MKITKIAFLLLLFTLVSCTQAGPYDQNMDEGVDMEVIETEESNIDKTNFIVENGDSVALHYLGTLENGEKFDSSYDRGQTLDFTVGAGQMITGFDSGVVGMKIGEKKTLTLAPEDAYGVKDDANVQVVSKSELTSFTDAGIVLEVGVKLPSQGREFEIIAVDEENVTLDVNHPLAGKTLIFQVEMIDIIKEGK